MKKLLFSETSLKLEISFQRVKQQIIYNNFPITLQDK